MATRSSIARLTKHGVESIYCHWDGYPEGVGATLNEHYQLQEKIDKLMELGDLSVLDENLGVKQDFDNRVEGWCLAYGRDRGEEGTQSIHHKTVRDWIASRESGWVDYGYLWNGNEWQTFDFSEEQK